jgi:hypothetical protein
VALAQIGGSMSAPGELHPLLDSVLDLLAERVAARVLQIIGMPATQPVVYTTNKRGPHIPRKRRRWMVDRVKDMPNARKVGRDWEISAADYEAWAAAEDARRCATRARPRSETPTVVKSEPPANDLARRAARSLDAQGFRRTR